MGLGVQGGGGLKNLVLVIGLLAVVFVAMGIIALATHTDLWTLEIHNTTNGDIVVTSVKGKSQLIPAQSLYTWPEKLYGGGSFDLDFTAKLPNEVVIEAKSITYRDSFFATDETIEVTY